MMSFSHEIKGVIFDVDGVLLDSLEIWTDLGARYLVSIGKVPEEGLADALFSMSMVFRGYSHRTPEYAARLLFL